MFINYLLYPLLEIGLNSWVQYNYYREQPWLFPLYPFNNYRLIDRFYYIFNFFFLTFGMGYIFNNCSMAEDISFWTNCWHFVALLVLESGIVYYGHRYSHYNKFIYNNIHRIHHNYINVKPFEGSCASPLDIMLFIGLILLLPFYIFQLSTGFYYLYTLVVIGTGILDHSGVEIKFLFYNSASHFIHHRLPNKNYGFPLSIFDKIHGTYMNQK
jgi:sterol desaturase/sphingolipid hydroxylase (fatty acid hydroxylase superfamily)